MIACRHARRDIDGLWRAFRDYLESPTSAADASLARLDDRLRAVKVPAFDCARN